jgi:hypothetical protein
MPFGSPTLRVYQDLADWYEGQSQAQMRDRFLLLAADTAMAEGHPDEAERLRLRLLEHSPHHMLRPFSSFAEAMRSPDVQGYLSDLRQTYPPDTAEQLLESLQSNGASAPPAAAPPPPASVPASPGPTRQMEPLKVYRVKEEEARPAPAAAPRRPAPAPGEAAPPAAARPATSRSAAPQPLPPLAGFPAAPAVNPRPLAATAPPRAPAAPRPEPAYPGPLAAVPAGRVQAEEATESTGSWAAVGLFGIVLLAAAALAVYAFARPFLPPQWLP